MCERKKASTVHLKSVWKAKTFRTLFFLPKNREEVKTITCRYFTYEDRKHFEEQYKAGAALPDIADNLGVHISTIYRELNRGRMFNYYSSAELYKACINSLMSA